MAVVIDDTEHQAAESGAVDSFAIRGMRALPAARIAFVPFSLVEVELLPDEE